MLVSIPSSLFGPAEDPTTWGATIARLIEDRGLLSDDNGTCSFAEQQVVTLALAAAPAMAPSAGCPPGCADCMGGCRPHLLRVTALSSAIAQGAKLPSPALEACAHCASQAVGYECMQLCPEVFEEVARQTLTGRLPEGAGLSCVRPSELRDFQILSKLGAQTAYWELFLGTVYAVLSVGQLMPLALSLVLGAHKGSGIAKSVIPQSRLPGVVSVSASLLAFPFVFQLVVVIQSSVGTLLTLIAVLFLLLAVAFFMKPLAYLKANSNKELGKGESLRGTLAKLCILISLGFFVASAASSDLAATVLTAACKQDMCFSRIDLQQALRVGCARLPAKDDWRVPWKCVSCLSGGDLGSNEHALAPDVQSTRRLNSMAALTSSVALGNLVPPWR